MGTLACGEDALREPGLSPDAAAPLVDPNLPRFDALDRQVVDPFAGSCASQTIRPDKVGLDLVFMIDTSGSMLDETSSGSTKWSAVRSAFGSFVRSADSTGVGAAFHFFPLVQPGVPEECSNDNQCGAFGPCAFFRACAGSSNVLACQSDADCGARGPCVALGECGVQKTFCGPVGARCSEQAGDTCLALAGRCANRDICAHADYAGKGSALVDLPSGGASLVSLLEAQEPEGATPTGPALAGALQRARAIAMNRPGRKVAVVLATDGFPTSCSPRNVNDIAALATEAVASSPSIPTFVVGVFAPDEAGAASTNLSRLAQAGGTPAPFIVSTSGNVSGAFLAALNDIRATALACEYKIPEAERGQIDLDQLNVRFLTGNGSSLTIGNVPNVAACHATKGGWYYELDPAGTPIGIKVCEATCTRLEAEPRGRVDLIVGCKTVRVD